MTTQQTHVSRAVILIFFGVFASHPVWAAPKKISLQFVTFPRWTERQPIEMAIGGGETIKLEVPSNSLSQAYPVPPLKNWVFGKPTVQADGKPGFEEFAKCGSLSSDKQIILLIREGDKPSDGMRAIPLDGNMDGFGPGKFFFHNASKVPVAGRMGKTEFVVQPNTNKVVALSSRDMRKRGDHQFVFTTLFFQANEEAHPLLNTNWPAYPTARSMVFFYHDAVSTRLRMHTIQDFGS